MEYFCKARAGFKSGIIFFLLFIIITQYRLISEEAGKTISLPESRYIVEMPTAGIVPKNSFSIYAAHYSGGGIMGELTASPFEGFNMGLSMSGSNIIGIGDVKWQSLPGISLRYRLFDEKLEFPALLIGISTQGRGNFDNNNKRFETLSPGLYSTLCKTYKWLLGTVTFHFGLNYSFEVPPEYRMINYYMGFEQLFNEVFAANLEYNATVDEYNTKYKSKKGLLNVSLKFYVSKEFTIELQGRDLLIHSTGATAFSRNICFEFTKSIK
jgi:hypothetical protein